MIRTACFDLETTSLNANFGVLLCGVVKEAGAEPRVLRADHYCPDWARRRSDDGPLVREIAQVLSGYDILIAHNGAGFDIPFLRTRLAFWRLPPFPPIKLVDPYKIARNKFRMSSNSLAALSDFLGQDLKTPVRGEYWLRAALDGDREALDYIVDHCIKDVLMLEALVDRVKGYSSAINTWGSGW